MVNKIIIVGCGWLGQHVASTLATAGLRVFGSRRSSEAAQSLSAIHGVVLPLTDTVVAAEIQALFHDAWVICTIPPGGRHGAASSDYLRVLRNLALLCQQSGIKGGIHIKFNRCLSGLSR
ncbi:hypothetical protein [Alishewanella longhuensis]